MSKENSKAVELENLVNIVVLIDGEAYNLLVSPADALRYETAKNSAKPADKEFVFGLKTKALKSAIIAIKAETKAGSAKRKVTRAEVVAEVIAEDITKINDTEYIVNKVAEAGKKYGLIPNDDEVAKYNLPKVRAAFAVITSKFNLTAKE